MKIKAFLTLLSIGIVLMGGSDLFAQKTRSELAPNPKLLIRTNSAAKTSKTNVANPGSKELPNVGSKLGELLRTSQPSTQQVPQKKSDNSNKTLLQRDQSSIGARQTQKPDDSKTTATKGNPLPKSNKFGEPLTQTPSIANRAIKEQKTGGSATTPQLQNNKLLTDGRQAQRTGDLKTAVTKYDQAIQSAQKSREPEVEATATIQKARVLESIAAANPSDKKTAQEAVRHYESAIRLGNPQQKSLARNNLGTLLLSQNKPAESIQVLKQLDVASLSSNQQLVYQYNLARAHELNKEPDAALAQYQKAIAQNAAFDKPVDGAFRILYAPKAPRLRQAAELATNLLHQGQTEKTAQQLKEGLLQHPNHPEADYLLAALVRYYADVGLTPPDFQRREQAFVTTLRERSEKFGGALQELQSAFTGRLKPTFGLSEVREAFPFWSGAQHRSQAMSLLLKTVGDYYSQAGGPEGGEASASPGRALGCYSAGWTLDHQNLEAALYTAAVLRDQAQALDPRGLMMERFIDILFNVKGASYAVDLKTEDDWQNILRCHLVLATIFERQERWGPDRDTHSVIFQLSRALDAEERLRRTNPQFAPSPGLYSRLAKAYVQTDRKNQAWGFYMKAAEGFLHHSNRQSAAQALTNAEALNLQLDPTSQERVRTVTAGIRG